MKRSLKTIVSIVLVVVMVFAFASCSSEIVSAYDIAVKNGYEGTEAEWLDSLKGDSAYEIAVNNGFEGTESEWLASLQGADGEDGEDGQNAISDLTIEEIYDAAVEDGYNGTLLDFVSSYLSTGNSDNSVKYASSLALLSAVSVYCTFTIRGNYGRTSETSAAGAGVIYKLDKETGTAYIITNYHVVYESTSTATNKIADSIQILLYGLEYSDRVIDATYVGGSMTYDIAVVKVENCDYLRNSVYRAVDIADSDQILVGETAIAIGNPEAEGVSVTSGIACVESEYIEMTAADDTTTVEYRVIRIDTAVNSGNSGGGLFNSNGELIGIVNAKTMSDDVENIGYAIPSNIAVGVAQNIIDNCDGKTNEKVLKYVLGCMVEVSDVTITYDEVTNTTRIIQEITVQSVNEGAIAEGYLQVDDVLVSVELPTGETRTINRLHTSVDAMLWIRQGDSVTYNIIRNVDGVDTQMAITIEFSVAPNEVD